MIHNCLRQVPSMLACLCLAAVSAGAQSVDLTSWTAESYPAVAGFGAGVWSVAPGGISVTQSVNGQPTFFASRFDAFNLQLEGQISAGAGDDDFVGFALGFDAGESTNPAADYLLVDWKRLTQSYNFGAPSCTPGSNARVGLAVSRVRGIPTADEFWGHVNLDASPCSTASDGLVELARANTLGATGWVANQTYEFRFLLTATSLKVYVDDVLELDIAGLFTDGGFAFYNFSQASVTYSAYTASCLAQWANYGFGSPGTLGIPSLSPTAAPVLGTTMDVVLSSASPSPSVALLGFGNAPAAIPLEASAYIWVDLEGTFPLVLGKDPLHIPYAVPLDPALCGSSLYAQFAHQDAAGVLGLAFSPGLELVFGT